MAAGVLRVSVFSLPFMLYDIVDSYVVRGCPMWLWLKREGREGEREEGAEEGIH